MAHPSTFSIVAYDPDERSWGIAVASKFLAVGAVVPWARANAGAIATQSYANTAFGPRGLALLELGLPAQQTLDVILGDDPQAEMRQVGIVDRFGNAATHTGQKCHEWAGGITGRYFATQGNILSGPEVLAAMASAFEDANNKTLMRRLYNALLAGDRSGGDRRGRQSAAILIVKPQGGYGGFNDRFVDYRVDDHPDPVVRLGEILDLHDLYFEKSSEDNRVKLSGQPLVRLQVLMTRLGYYKGELHGEYDIATRIAFESFIGNENYEERADFSDGMIDLPVIEHLFKQFGG